jgi:hypothetical protein
VDLVAEVNERVALAGVLTYEVSGGSNGFGSLSSSASESGSTQVFDLLFEPSYPHCKIKGNDKYTIDSLFRLFDIAIVPKTPNGLIRRGTKHVK